MISFAIDRSACTKCGECIDVCCNSRMGLSEILFNSEPTLKAEYGIPKGERVDGIVVFGYSTVDWKRIPPRGPAKVVWN